MNSGVGVAALHANEVKEVSRARVNLLLIPDDGPFSADWSSCQKAKT